MMAFAATFRYKIARYQSSRWNLFQLLCFDIQHNLHACCLGNAQVDILPCIPSLTLLWNVSLARRNLLAQIEALKGMQRLGIKPNWEDQFITEGYCVWSCFQNNGFTKPPAVHHYIFTSSCVDRSHRIPVVNRDVTAGLDKKISATRTETCILSLLPFKV